MPNNNIHIIIGDAHAKPGIDNRRFDWAGKLVLETRLKHPDANISVIDMGDWEDMPSLSSYDMGKKCYEGRRYNLDLAAAWDARARFNSPINEYNKAAREQHKRRISVSKYSLGGNHFEGRIERAVQLSPMLEGTIGIDDGRHTEFGWEYVPFNEPLLLDGFNYCHSFPSGVLGRPIGGESPAKTLIQKQLTSCVAGHLHLLDLCNRTNPQGRAIWGVFPGCFLDPNQWEEYAGQANLMWKRGVLILYGVKDGDFRSFEWKGIENLRESYAQRV